MSSLKEMVISVPGEEVEKLMEVCLDQGAVSVSIYDSNENTSSENPIYYDPDCGKTEYWETCLLKILLPLETDEKIFFNDLLKIQDVHIEWVSVHTLVSKKWEEDFKQYFPVKIINQSLRVIPKWEPLPEDSIPNLIVDPGLAFGTGTHPTTHMCLHYLTTLPLKNKAVLDWGCGSGILAIAASILGSENVCGLDIDLLAIEAARENAILNGQKIAFYHLSHWQRRPVHVILANLLLNPLLGLTQVFHAHLSDGGELVMSGILAHQKNQIMDIYCSCFELKQETEEENWLCLVFGKKSDEAKK